MLSYPILYYTILYYTVLYCTILYYTIRYYTILYYTIRSPTLLGFRCGSLASWYRSCPFVSSAPRMRIKYSLFIKTQHVWLRKWETPCEFGTSVSYSPYSTPLWNRFEAVLGCSYRLGRETSISQNWLKG